MNQSVHFRTILCIITNATEKLNLCMMKSLKKACVTKFQVVGKGSGAARVVRGLGCGGQEIYIVVVWRVVRVRVWWALGVMGYRGFRGADGGV